MVVDVRCLLMHVRLHVLPYEVDGVVVLALTRMLFAEYLMKDGVVVLDLLMVSQMY